ncbi:MAG: DUF167 domain-containing protein [Candidatus Anammoxibacter sp.]
MVKVTETDSGILLLLKVQPNAKKNSIVGKHGDRLKISVTAPPDKGKANKAVIKLIATELKVKTSQVSVVSGQTSRDKKVQILGVSLKHLRQFEIVD